MKQRKVGMSEMRREALRESLL